MFGWMKTPSVPSGAAGPEARAPAIEEKTSKAGAIIALHTTGRPVWTPRTYAALARAGYMKNDVTPVSHPAGTGIRRSSNTRDGCPSKSSFITHRAAYWMGDCHPSRECGRSML